MKTAFENSIVILRTVGAQPKRKNLDADKREAITDRGTCRELRHILACIDSQLNEDNAPSRADLHAHMHIE